MRLRFKAIHWMKSQREGWWVVEVTGKDGSYTPRSGPLTKAKAEKQAAELNATAQIQSRLKQCIEGAREQGWSGADVDYEHTAEDLQWVVEKIGYEPTLKNLAEALRWLKIDADGQDGQE